MNGLTAEKVVYLFLKQMGFKLPEAREMWAVRDLRATAKKVSPIHYKRCCASAERNGVNLESTANARLLLDSIYKVDQLIEVPHLWGLQLTLSLADRYKKAQQLRAVTPMAQAIGIKKLGLIGLALPHSSQWEGVALLDGDSRDRIENSIFDALEELESGEYVAETFLDLSWL